MCSADGCGEHSFLKKQKIRETEGWSARIFYARNIFLNIIKNILTNIIKIIIINTIIIKEKEEEEDEFNRKRLGKGFGNRKSL